MKNWFEKCLIGSESFIKELRKKRIIGIKRIEQKTVPDLIPLDDIDLFTLDKSSSFFQPEEELIIENIVDVQSGKMGVREIILYVKKGDK